MWPWTGHCAGLGPRASAPVPRGREGKTTRRRTAARGAVTYVYKLASFAVRFNDEGRRQPWPAPNNKREARGAKPKPTTKYVTSRRSADGREGTRRGCPCGKGGQSSRLAAAAATRRPVAAPGARRRAHDVGARALSARLLRADLDAVVLRRARALAQPLGPHGRHEQPSDATRTSFLMSKTPCWIFSWMFLAVLIKASSTLAAVLADVSRKSRPCSRANCSPSSRDTARLASRSLRAARRQVSWPAGQPPSKTRTSCCR